jgi:hypothetical protein
MAAGLPSKSATSLDARFCAVMIALGDVMQEIFSSSTAICSRLLSCGSFPRYRSRVVPLKETELKRWAAWIGAAGGMPGLLSAAEAASAAPCDVKNNPPPFIRHDLSASYCELRGYGYVTVAISSPYEGVDMTHMTVVENLRSSGLTVHPDAPNPVTYSVNGGGPHPGSAPVVSGTNGSILTSTSSRIPALARLEDPPGNNQSATIGALAARNVVLPGGSPCLVASDNIVDFIVTGDFAAFTSNRPWGETYQRYANTSFYPGGKIWTCR